MCGEGDRLELSVDELGVLEQLAEQFDQPVADFVDGCVEVGLSLGAVAIGLRPQVARIGFPYGEDYVFYPLVFTGGRSREVPPELIPLEAQIADSTKVPLPLDNRLLKLATNMAGRLCVARAEFVETSIFLGWQLNLAVRKGCDVVLEDPPGSGEYYVIELCDNEDN